MYTFDCSQNIEHCNVLFIYILFQLRWNFFLIIIFLLIVNARSFKFVAYVSE